MKKLVKRSSNFFREILLVNVAVSAIFTFYSYQQWSLFNHYQATMSYWNPISILVTPIAISNGNAIPYSEILEAPNPFVFFWVAVAINLFVIYKLTPAKKPSK